jgi:hypothetical protein
MYSSLIKKSKDWLAQEVLRLAVREEEARAELGRLREQRPDVSTSATDLHDDAVGQKALDEAERALERIREKCASIPLGVPSRALADSIAALSRPAEANHGE